LILYKHSNTLHMFEQHTAAHTHHVVYGEQFIHVIILINT
jgi:hypothetical protein